MAVLTLNNIKKNLDFNHSDQVKITRKDVKKTILASKLTARSNTLLSLLFNLSSRHLKTTDWQYLPETAKEQ
jgi:farnesyl-diphosphate farnesyltransferase